MTTATLFGVGEASAAKDSTNTVIEMAPPPADFATNAAALRSAAEAEIKNDPILAKTHRKLIVSMSVTRAASSSLACNVNATVRDAKTGRMIAIIETNARSQGPLSPELRKEMAHTAVRDAARKVPSVLSK